MGKYLEKFKKIVGKADNKANEYINKKETGEVVGGRKRDTGEESLGDDIYDGIDDDDVAPDTTYESEDPYYDDVGIRPSQKPESFHHFILENQYKDLERSIRGFKEVLNKETQKWTTKRKGEHCFTDEESEDILRTAQGHLATDIKLSFINKEVFGQMMMAIYRRIDELFYSISEYRYGRYSYQKGKDGCFKLDKDGKPMKKKEGDAIQYRMKLQNRKIFLELWARIQANYSRAIAGSENKLTHDSVKGQESLQNNEQDFGRNRGYS